MILPRRLSWLVVSLTALLAIPLAAPAATATPPPAATDVTSIVVDGNVSQPLTLTIDDLRTDLPGRTVLVTFVSGSDRERHVYRGVLLFDVLNAAVPAFDPNRRNDKLRHSVLVTATDDYQAVVAWGEFDPDFEGKLILLAYREDGQLLERPRLVVPGDERGGRYVFDVTTVTLQVPATP